MCQEQKAVVDFLRAISCLDLRHGRGIVTGLCELQDMFSERMTLSSLMKCLMLGAFPWILRLEERPLTMI